MSNSVPDRAGKQTVARLRDRVPGNRGAGRYVEVGVPDGRPRRARCRWGLPIFWDNGRRHSPARVIVHQPRSGWEHARTRHRGAILYWRRWRRVGFASCFDPSVYVRTNAIGNDARRRAALGRFRPWAPTGVSQGARGAGGPSGPRGVERVTWICWGQFGRWDWSDVMTEMASERVVAVLLTLPERVSPGGPSRNARFGAVTRARSWAKPGVKGRKTTGA